MTGIGRVLALPSTPGRILILAMLLTATSLATGFFGDDYIHYALLSPENRFLKPDDASLFGLFSFINGDSQRNQTLRDLGLIPWWTYDGLKYAFWRPVSEISHWVDHKLWPRSPVIMHLHNMAWYFVLCAVVLTVYRKISRAQSGLLIGASIALYALDATHGFAVSWIANRNSLIAASIGMSSFVLYLSYIESGKRLQFFASVLLMLLALLSAEAGVSTLAYFGAYALTLDKRGPVRGLLAIAPHGLIFIAWWTLYKHLGFGAANADAYYVDPTANPVFYLTKLIERLPVLLASQYGFLPAEIYGFSGRTIPAYVLAATIFLMIVIYVVWPMIRTNSVARFWALGTLFSLAPIASALPHDRNLIFVGIGASALLAHALEALHTTGFRGKKSWRYATMLIVALNLYIGTVLTPLTAYLPKIWSDQMQLDATLLPQINDIRSKNIFLLGTPLAAALAVTPVNYFNGNAMPEKLWILSTDADTFNIKRVSQGTLEIRKLGPFVTPLEQTLRNITVYPFSVDEEIILSGATIKIAEVNDARQPTKLFINIDEQKLPSTAIVAWNGSQYKIIQIPAIGDETTVVTTSMR